MTLPRIPVDSAEAAELREAEDAQREHATVPPARASAPHDSRCRRGWLGEDPEGRPIPCPHCRPHLRDRAYLVCDLRESACSSRRERLGIRCCEHCEHASTSRGPASGTPRSGRMP